MTHTRSPSPAQPHGVAIGKALLASLGLVLLTLTGPAQGQFLLSETTWGGTGAEVATAVATAPDGSAYLVGSTDSFAFDQFGQPATRIFIVKLSNGAVVWQRIWNGPTIVGVTDASVAVAADGSAYVAGITADGGGDAVLLKFDPNGNLLWERAWGGTESDSAGAVATHSDGSVYVAGRTTSFGPSSAGVFVLKFDSAGTLLWQRLWDDAAGFEAMAVTLDGSIYAASSRLRPNSNFSQFDVMVLKLAPAGILAWARTYGAGEVVDARGGMAAAADGSIYTAGAIQAAKGGIVGIAALVLKIGADGSLLFGKECCTKGGDTGEGIAVAPDGSVLSCRNDNGVGRWLPGCVRRTPGVDRQEGDSRGHLGRHRLRNRWRGRGCARQHGAACSHDEHGPAVFAAGGAAQAVRAEIHRCDSCGRARGSGRHDFDSPARGVPAGRQHHLQRKLRGGLHWAHAAVAGQRRSGSATACR